MKTFLLTLALSITATAQTPMPIIPPTGHVPTPDVTLAYWVYGPPQPTTPIFADAYAESPRRPISPVLDVI